MSDPHPQLLTIGQLARRTGLAVRTIRYWSDVGALPPAGRSDGGYRLYDAESVARLELVRTLRELGIGLGDVHRVLSGDSTVAEVAATHVAALDAQIRALKLSRAVLSTVAKRGSTTEETALMNKLARLSAAERRKIIDDFTAEVFEGLGVASRVSERMRANPIELPEDPTPEQVDAWIELAELVQDPDFRSRMRTLMTLTTPGPGEKPPPGASVWFAGHAVQVAAAARSRGVDPARPGRGRRAGRPLRGGRPGRRTAESPGRHARRSAEVPAARGNRPRTRTAACSHGGTPLAGTRSAGRAAASPLTYRARAHRSPDHHTPPDRASRPPCGGRTDDHSHGGVPPLGLPGREGRGQK